MMATMTTDVTTVRIEHMVRVTTFGRNHAFSTPPMLASKGRQWAEMESVEPDTVKVVVECDNYCWCK